MKKKLIGVEFDTCDSEDAKYTAYSLPDCRDDVDAMLFERIMRDRETEVITQGHTFAKPIWVDDEPKNDGYLDDTQLEALADKIGDVICDHFAAEFNGDHFIIMDFDGSKFKLSCQLERIEKGV